MGLLLKLWLGFLTGFDLACYFGPKGHWLNLFGALVCGAALAFCFWCDREMRRR